MHWAYVEWTPDFEGEHEVTVTAEHKHKACAAKSDDTDVIVECDVTLPDVLRHVVWADSKDAAMAAARCFALNSLPWGASYEVVYIGVVSA